MDFFDSLNEALLRKASEDRSIPATVRRMLEIHVRKPWVEGFKTVVLSPLGDGLEGMTDTPAFEWEGRQWYTPSLGFWLAHAKASHPPEGRGCDPTVHVDFLTAEGRTSEFLYANLLSSGEAYILGSEDFSLECDWWYNYGAVEFGEVQ